MDNNFVQQTKIIATHGKMTKTIKKTTIIILCNYCRQFWSWLDI